MSFCKELVNDKISIQKLLVDLSRYCKLKNKILPGGQKENVFIIKLGKIIF
jgi:hypothetical protein